MPNRRHNKRNKDCTKCKIVPCTNFYRKGEGFEGGEIYVFEKLVEKRVVLPCNVGDVIYALCQLWSNLGSDFPSSEMFYQCIRDLRASAYLLLSCHYRSAIQLLRPVVENYVVGIFFDAKFLLLNRLDAKRSFKSFLNDKYVISADDWKKAYSTKPYRNELGYGFCLRWLKEVGVGIKNETEIYKIMDQLNDYLHPNFGTFEIGKAGCPGCSSFVKYEKREYEKCLKLYQDTVALMLTILYDYTQKFYPERVKSAEKIIKKSLGICSEVIWVEKEVGSRLIFSEKFRQFIKDFSST